MDQTLDQIWVSIQKHETEHRRDGMTKSLIALDLNVFHTMLIHENQTARTALNRRKYRVLKCVFAYMYSYSSNQEYDDPAFRLVRFNFYSKADQLDRLLMFRVYQQSLNVSVIYHSFIRGITYFVTDTGLEWPYYHRTQSCGPRNNQQGFIDSNLSCQSIDPSDPDELERRRKAIFTCFLERIIYNKLHNHYKMRQDNGHEYEVFVKMQQLFRECYGISSDISVNVEYRDNLPCRVIVHFTSTQNERKEVYIKTLSDVETHQYDEPVMCACETLDRLSNIRTTLHKQQAFDGETQWTVLREDQLGGSGKRYFFLNGKRSCVKKDKFGHDYIMKNRKRLYV
jgi:hypothetical protein